MTFATRFLKSGLIFWLLLLAVGSWLLYPLRKNLKFGIDLVGGTYMTLRVQAEKLIEADLKDIYKELETELKSNSKGLSAEALAQAGPKSYKVENNKLEITFDTYESANAAQALLSEIEHGLISNIQGSVLIVHFDPKKEENIKKEALSSDVEVLRTRLNSIGVEEIKVAPQGEKDIVIELPDITDFKKAKEIIGKPANLEFRLVEAIGATKDEIKDKFGGEIPSGYEILAWTSKEGDSKKYVLVQDYAEVSGKHLKEVTPSVGQTKRGISEAVVQFKLTPQGTKKFAELTAENIGKPLAIVLDGKVISAPNINEEIPNGTGSISGNFTIESAKELANLLKSGSFVAPVTFEEERSIGPALGYEAIKSGVIACLVGLVLLFAFSVIVYKLSGLFAFLALIYNLFLLIFAMYLLKATLTLSGIAGMVLTIGMAIDSSILIYERIRELLAHGETVLSSIKKGFSGALGVILDANITTFITGIVLFYFGTGPVKGFAVTLMIGIVATLVAGLLFLRSLFSTFVKSGVQKLSI